MARSMVAMLMWVFAGPVSVRSTSFLSLKKSLAQPSSSADFTDRIDEIVRHSRARIPNSTQACLSGVYSLLRCCVMKEQQCWVKDNRTNLSESKCCDKGEVDDVLKGQPKLPETLRGRNLVIAGDSNDRIAVEQFCREQGSQIKAVQELLADDGPAGGPFTGETFRVAENRRSRIENVYTGIYCHVQTHNMSVMYLFHPGGMSIEPEPIWHRDFIFNSQRHTWLPNSTSGGYILNKSTDLPKFFWRRTVSDHLPHRPVVLVAQSSLWDLMPARDWIVADDKLREKAFNMSLLWDTYLDNRTLPGLTWMDHASSFMSALRGMQLPIEKVFWRTHRGCPMVTDKQGLRKSSGMDWYDRVFMSMREAVASAISEQRGPWKDVSLVDFMRYADPDVVGGCKQTVHFNDYTTYWQVMFATLGVVM